MPAWSVSGFAMTENILYYGRALQGGVGGLTVVFIIRGMAAPFSHPLFTSMTGIGLGWARQSNNGFIKVTMPVLGFMLAILMHATWNGTATYGGAGRISGRLLPDHGPGFYHHADGDLFLVASRRPHCAPVSLCLIVKTAFSMPRNTKSSARIRGRMGMSWNALTTQGFSYGERGCAVTRSPVNWRFIAVAWRAGLGAIRIWPRNVKTRTYIRCRSCARNLVTVRGALR